MSLGNRVLTAEEFYASEYDVWGGVGEDLAASIQGIEDEDECAAKFLEILIPKYKGPVKLTLIAACASQDIKKIFFENRVLQKRWLEELDREANYPILSLISMDGNRRLTPFHHYMANAAKVDGQHDVACESGLLISLDKRCRDNIGKLAKLKPNDDFQDIILQIKRDFDAIDNLFWQRGYVLTAELSLRVADANANVENAYRSRALYDFLCARYLHKNKASRAIVDCMSRGLGLGEFFEQPELLTIDWTDTSDVPWMKVEPYLKQKFGSTEYVIQDSFAKNEMKPFMHNEVVEDPESGKKDDIKVSASHRGNHGLHKTPKDAKQQKEDLLQRLGQTHFTKNSKS